MLNDLATLIVVAGLTLVLILSLNGGWRAYRFVHKHDSETNSPGAGYIVSASLALLGLLLAFTLALSLDRYELRRQLVVAEANAISTFWLRHRLLNEPYRSRIGAVMRSYVRERRALPTLGTDQAALDAADQRTAALQQKIWSETMEALREAGGAAFATPLLQAANAMFDLTAERRAAIDAQVPQPILWSVIAIAVLSAAITGYGLAASGRRHWAASGALFCGVALLITLIIELDQPRTGFIKVPQTPIDRVSGAILAASPDHP